MHNHFEIKQRIAERAAQLVEPGETILIESGSTNALLARKLAETQDVTIITNSYFIASFVRDLPRAKIILLGGDYQPDAELCVGPLARQALESFYVDKLFIGSDGFSEEGFTNMDLLRAEVASAMARRANRTIVLTDSSKFSTRGVSRQRAFSEVSLVITDDGIPDFARQLLKKSKVELITVPKC
jgi:DeoR/GlpR family transcriptional regulator of sugar metabolism